MALSPPTAAIKLQVIKNNHDKLLLILIGILVVVASAVLLGWIIHSPLLVQIAPTFVPMQFNTALSFLAAGVSLLAIFYNHKKTAVALSLVLIVLSIAAISSYLLVVNSPLDTLFIEPFTSVRTPYPGRMGMNTAVCFFLTGASLIAVVWQKHKAHAAVLNIALCLQAGILILALAALLGYFTRVDTASEWRNWSGMAIHTAIGFVFVASAIVLVVYDDFPSMTQLPNLWLPLVGAGVVAAFLFATWQYEDRVNRDAFTKNRQMVAGSVLQIAKSNAALLADDLQWLLLQTGSQQPISQNADSNLLHQMRKDQYLLIQWQSTSGNELQTIHGGFQLHSEHVQADWQRKIIADLIVPSAVDQMSSSLLTGLGSDYWFVVSYKTLIADGDQRALIVVVPFNNLTSLLMPPVSSFTQVWSCENISLNNASETEQHPANALVGQEQVSLFNQNWTLQLYASAEFSRLQSFWVIVADLLAVITVGLVLYLFNKSARTAKALRASENRSYAVVNSAADGFILAKVDGTIETVNSAANTIFGYEAGELIGQNVSNLMPEPHRSQHSRYLQNYFSSGKASVISQLRELQGIRKDGVVFPIDLYLARFDLDNETKICGYIRDISDNVGYREQLLLSEQRFQGAVDAIGSGVWQKLDMAEDAMFWSDRFYELIHYDPEALEPKESAFLQLMPSDDLSRYQALINSHLNGGEPVDCEVQMRCGDGYGLRWFRVNAKATFDSSNNPVRIAGSILDIDTRKQLAMERARLVDIIDHASLYVIQYNAERQPIFVNRSLRQLGVDFAAVENASWLNDQSRSDFTESVFLQAESEGSCALELTLHRTGGGDIPVRALLMAHKNSPNEVGHFSLVCRDVSEVRAKEIELQAAVAELAMVMDGSNDGFWHLSMVENKNFQCSDHFYRLLGFIPSELVFSLRQLLRRVMPEDRQRLLQDFRRAIGDNGLIETEVRICGKSGESRWYRIKCRCYFAETTRQLLEVAGSISDFHQVKSLQQDLIEKNRDLEQFAFVASHDLKEPLRTLRTFSDHLSHDLENQDQAMVAEDLEFIQDASIRMTVLVDDLLQFARVGSSSIQFDACNLNGLLREMIDDLALRINELGAEIDVAENLGTIYADDVLMRLVFQNLLQNALKFQKPGNKPRVKIRSEMTENTVKVYMSDNGIGIAPEHQKQIFGVFKKLHKAEDYPGTGIGLAVVAKIIDRHAGKVEVQSALGEGATFVLELPKGYFVEQKKDG